MDFKITPGSPDGVCIEVMFYAGIGKRLER